jgi:hypothetical protein
VCGAGSGNVKWLSRGCAKAGAARRGSASAFAERAERKSEQEGSREREQDWWEPSSGDRDRGKCACRRRRARVRFPSHEWSREGSCNWGARARVWGGEEARGLRFRQETGRRAGRRWCVCAGGGSVRSANRLRGRANGRAGENVSRTGESRAVEIETDRQMAKYVWGCSYRRGTSSRLGSCDRGIGGARVWVPRVRC